MPLSYHGDIQSDWILELTGYSLINNPELCDHQDSNSSHWVSSPQPGSPTARALPLHGF